MAVTSKTRRARPKKPAGRKMKAKNTVKRRSAAAAALASPLYHKRVVKSAKTYRRKVDGRMPEEEGEQA